MKNLIRFCIIIILSILLGFTLHAQEQYAKLEKNRNIQAQGLIHQLNKTSDTLILKSDKIIHSLYTINQNYTRELDIEIDSTAYKLPLNKLSIGKHVFVARQAPMKIIFVVRILKEIPTQLPESYRTKALVAIKPLSPSVVKENSARLVVD